MNQNDWLLPGGLMTLVFAEAGVMFLLGYVLGSIPFGLLLTRLGGTADLRSIGSGNIGATNVLRTGRKDLAAATLLLDALKGTLAVLIAARFGVMPAMLAGLGAFLGHVYPVWLRFQGGKGVATYIGVLLALWWPGFLAFAFVWLATAALTRYSSLASLLASLIVPLFVHFAGHGPIAVVLSLMTILLWWKHRPNIQRLASGTESRIGSKA